MKVNIISYSFVLLVALFLSGYKTVNLADLETAVVKKEYSRAKKMAQDVLSREKVSAKRFEAKYYLGLVHLALGENKNALNVFKALSSEKLSQPLKDKVQLALFDSYYVLEQYKEALKSVKKLGRKRRKSEFLSLIYLKVARANLKLARWDDAQLYLNKIVNELPNSFEAHIAQQLLGEKHFYAVQVGAFLEQKRAEQLSRELKQQDEYAYIVETVDRQQRKFYRVRVGQMTELSEAKLLKTRFSKLGYPAQIYP